MQSRVKPHRGLERFDSLGPLVLLRERQAKIEISRRECRSHFCGLAKGLFGTAVVIGFKLRCSLREDFFKSGVLGFCWKASQRKDNCQLGAREGDPSHGLQIGTAAQATGQSRLACIAYMSRVKSDLRIFHIE